MKIAIIGASGKQGSMLLKEALGRGHEVTAVVRKGSAVNEPKAKILEKDLFQLTYNDLKEYDVIIDAFGAWTPETVGQHLTSLGHLTAILGGKTNRLLVVGGAGSLFVDSGHKRRVMDAPDFPESWKPVALNMGAAFDMLKTRNDVNWTYLSPSANFIADGKRTGKYKAGSDELMVNSVGRSEISYADYAVAMIDEAEKGAHIKKRFTVVSE